MSYFRRIKFSSTFFFCEPQSPYILEQSSANIIYVTFMTLQPYSFVRNSLNYNTRCCFMFASIKFLFILLISLKDIVTSQPAVLFISVAQQPTSNLGWLVVDVFRTHKLETHTYTLTHTHTHTHTHLHTPSDSCGRAISWSPKAVTDAALNKQKTDLPCP